MPVRVPVGVGVLFEIGVSVHVGVITIVLVGGFVIDTRVFVDVGIAKRVAVDVCATWGTDVFV